MQVFDFEQGSDDWFAARAGIPTASEFAKVLAKGEGKTRRAYMLKLAGEIVTGQVAESYTNAHMERGKDMEGKARDYYAFLHNEPLTRVGFIRSGDAGCSPDALVGDAGVLEIKTALPHILIENILKGTFPAEHKAQCQGALWIAERQWVDIVIFWPGMVPFEKRAERDEEYIAELAREVERFNAELAEIVEKVRRYGAPSTLKADLNTSLTLLAG